MRHELKGYDLSAAPGGKVFDSLNEYSTFMQSDEDIAGAVLAAAAKEAREEVGVDPRTSEIFHKSVAGATMEMRYVLCCGE